VTRDLRCSVVIDNYDYGRFVGEAIESALMQTYQPVEVVVVDDGSSDDSRDIIASFGAAVIPVFKPNGGQASAVNRGFEASSGQLVVFLDADDLLRPEAMERAVDRWRPASAKLHFRLAAIDASGHELGFTVPPSGRPLGDGDVVPQLLADGRYVTPTMSGNVFSRAVLERILPVPEEVFRISADGYLVSSAPFYGQVEAIEEVLGSYRVHGGNWWAPSVIDAPRLRDFVLHDVAKHDCVRQHAEATGRHVEHDLGQRDQFHLRARLGSLRLEPHRHPIASDTRSRLVLAGVVATLRSPLSTSRRLAFAGWFLAVAYAPRRAAAALLRWLYVPQQRPPWARRASAVLKWSASGAKRERGSG
jgi:hypothetical protein